MTPRPIAGAFSPCPLYDGPIEDIGTVTETMIIDRDPRTWRIVLIPERERAFWTWFLDNRPDLVREMSEVRLAALEATKP